MEDCGTAVVLCGTVVENRKGYSATVEKSKEVLKNSVNVLEKRDRHTDSQSE